MQRGASNCPRNFLTQYRSSCSSPETRKTYPICIRISDKYFWAKRPLSLSVIILLVEYFVCRKYNLQYIYIYIYKHVRLHMFE